MGWSAVCHQWDKNNQTHLLFGHNKFRNKHWTNCHSTGLKIWVIRRGDMGFSSKMLQLPKQTVILWLPYITFGGLNNWSSFVTCSFAQLDTTWLFSVGKSKGQYIQDQPMHRRKSLRKSLGAQYWQLLDMNIKFVHQASSISEIWRRSCPTLALTSVKLYDRGFHNVAHKPHAACEYHRCSSS